MIMNKFFRIITIFIFTTVIANAQSDSLRRIWYLQDPDSSRYHGIAATTAYETILKGKTPIPVLVAVMDGGTDINHPDLAPVVWTNPKEIPGNNIDDDNNGYVDDLHGWSFIGDVDHDNTEVTRLYKAGKNNIPDGISWKKVKKVYKNDQKDALKQKQMVDEIADLLTGIKASKKGDTLTAEDVRSYPVKGLKMKLIRNGIANVMDAGMGFSYLEEKMISGKTSLDNVVNYHLNPAYESRNIVGDDYKNVNEKIYGNAHVIGPEALHGTHVAGIIAAARNNGIGMNGIADAKIMVLRVVPDGDERDKDIANGIRYAVDNGARLINMSFGKPFSPEKPVVDDAIRYAESKGVLIFHGSGNDGTNNDINPGYPNPFSQKDQSKASNWIEVGASDTHGRAAEFSNYGKSTVDIFAPGTSIYSTVNDSSYRYEDGTSMASPVVCGVAALVWSYYPTLTTAQLKECILYSAEKRNVNTTLPGKPKDIVAFDTLSATGGIVNVVRALEKAEGFVNPKP